MDRDFPPCFLPRAPFFPRFKLEKKDFFFGSASREMQAKHSVFSHYDTAVNSQRSTQKISSKRLKTFNVVVGHLRFTSLSCTTTTCAECMRRKPRRATVFTFMKIETKRRSKNTPIRQNTVPRLN